jgi:hypothetical protein
LAILALAYRRRRSASWSVAARAFTVSGPLFLALVFMGRVERLLGVGLLAWAASVVCSVGCGLAAKQEHRVSMGWLPITIGVTLAGLIVLVFLGTL